MSRFTATICQTEGNDAMSLIMYLQVETGAPSCKDCLAREAEQNKVYGYRLHQSEGYKLIELKFENELSGDTWLGHAIEYSGDTYFDNEIVVTDCCCALSWLAKVTAVRFAEKDSGFSLCAEDKIIYLYFSSEEAARIYVRDTMKLLRPVEVEMKGRTGDRVESSA